MANERKLNSRTKFEIHPDDTRAAIVAYLKSQYGIEVLPEMVTKFDGEEINDFMIATRLDRTDAKSA